MNNPQEWFAYPAPGASSEARPDLQPGLPPNFAAVPPPRAFGPLFGDPHFWTNLGLPPDPALDDRPTTVPLAVMMDHPKFGLLTLGYSPAVDPTQPIDLMLDHPTFGLMRLGQIVPAGMTGAPGLTEMPGLLRFGSLPDEQHDHWLDQESHGDMFEQSASSGDDGLKPILAAWHQDGADNDGTVKPAPVFFKKQEFNAIELEERLLIERGLEKLRQTNKPGAAPGSEPPAIPLPDGPLPSRTLGVDGHPELVGQVTSFFGDSVRFVLPTSHKSETLFSSSLHRNETGWFNVDASGAIREGDGGAVLGTVRSDGISLTSAGEEKFVWPRTFRTSDDDKHSAQLSRPQMGTAVPDWKVPGIIKEGKEQTGKITIYRDASTPEHFKSAEAVEIGTFILDAFGNLRENTDGPILGSYRPDGIHLTREGEKRLRPPVATAMASQLGFSYEIRNADEQKLVNDLLAEGKTGAEIAAALDWFRTNPPYGPQMPLEQGRVQTDSDGYTLDGIPIQIRHIIEGDVSFKGKSGGFHSRFGGKDPANSIMLTIVDPKNRVGVYTAEVAVKDPTTGNLVNKGSKSTFFPEWMTEVDIVTAIQRAFKDSGVTANGRFEGESGLGFRIAGFYRDGQITTAYPIWANM